MLVFMPLYIHMKNNEFATGITLFAKGFTTFVAAIFSLYGLFILSEANSKETAYVLFSHNWWIAIGLFICMLADVFLNLHFIAGGILFFIGHVCYIIFFLKLAPFSPLMIPIYSIVLVFCLCYFYKFHTALGNEKYLYSIYGATISASLAISFLLPFKIGIYGCFPALASFLLFISDILLARNLLYKETLLSDTLAISFYYTGQFLMAFTVYIPAILYQIKHDL